MSVGIGRLIASILPPLPPSVKETGAHYWDISPNFLRHILARRSRNHLFRRDRSSIDAADRFAYDRSLAIPAVEVPRC